MDRPGPHIQVCLTNVGNRVSEMFDEFLGNAKFIQISCSSKVIRLKLSGGGCLKKPGPGKAEHRDGVPSPWKLHMMEKEMLSCSFFRPIFLGDAC